MASAISLVSSARRDIHHAIDWEEEQNPGLGVRFTQDLAQRFIALTVTPLLGTLRYKNIRATPLRTFRYMVHYIFDEEADVVRVVRVFHTSRKPFWEE